MELPLFSQIMQDKCQIDHDQLLIVGVSGGMDSMCLLHLLYKSGYSIVAAHFDHSLRDTSSDDARFVQNASDLWGIPFELKRMDVNKYCKEHCQNIEESARNLRYEYLFDTAKNKGASAVLVAHHADDQVETVLMHFIRGAGLSGLKGMKYISLLRQFSKTIPIIRPMLDVTRKSIEIYCEENKIPFVMDKTNTDITFFRNRLRYELIPQMETYNPRFRETLIRTTHSLQADYDLINDLVSKEWEKVIIEIQTKFIKLNLARLRTQSKGLRWNMIIKAIKILRPDIRDFDQSVLIRLDELITGAINGKRIDLINHLESRIITAGLLICESGYKEPVLLFPQYNQPPQSLEFPLARDFSNGWQLSGCFKDNDMDGGYISMQPSYYEAWLDDESILGEVILRNVLPGDRIQSLGNEGHHAKVSDIFINHQIPKDARQAYPIFCDSKKIIWLPGIMISEKCKVTPSTKKILHLRITKV
jgi:tRNA(Ile)-lysidine synthase